MNDNKNRRLGIMAIFFGGLLIRKAIRRKNELESMKKEIAALKEQIRNSKPV